MAKRGVIMVNTGSPDAPEPAAVREYLQVFLTDPRIRPMHPFFWNLILHGFILPRRSTVSAAKYRNVWTESGSPLVASMASLAQKLDAVMPETAVRHAMSYGSPAVDDVVDELVSLGCDDIAVIALYPQSAYATTGVVADRLHAVQERLPEGVRVCLREGYSDEPLYIDAIAQSILDAGFGSLDKLLFAFHSIPMKDIRAGDTYDTQVRETVRAVVDRLGIEEDRWALGFQCRFDKSRKWLGPSIETAMTELIGDDVEAGNFEGRMFVVAPNFSIDCLETLHDIDIDLRWAHQYLAPDAPADRFVYVPCLNDSDAHVELMKSLLG